MRIKDVLVWVEIERSVLAWGEVLRGRVVIQGGQRPHQISNPIWATLGQRETEHPDDFHLLARELVVSAPRVIEPNARQYFQFVLPVPRTAPFQHKVILHLPMHGPNGRGPSLKIQVVPPEACRVIASQFCTVTQMRLRRWARTHEGDVEAWFDPLGGQSLFAEAALKLFGPRHPWCGRLFLVRQPRWRWWYGDQVCLDLPDFAPDPDTIREQFEGILHQAGFRPGVAGNLPLPADARRARPEELPLPSERLPPEPRDPHAG
jgi:hypothetical protein